MVLPERILPMHGKARLRSQLEERGIAHATINSMAMAATKVTEKKRGCLRKETSLLDPLGSPCSCSSVLPIINESTINPHGQRGE
jgi:hypothetical protein